ncbi:hypothetical protein [Variovorax sp. UMC13]|uniref:hypothetical protein n=1 Tax=Variovorax sp. UMC13 TaxID=1862326 RepID=UPI0015FEF2E5|nr:hypothetical protein [Variovorax sp. UMC13]MBB1601912.1 hypothetical protein [Variovorax sp. UMC13]
MRYLIAALFVLATQSSWARHPCVGTGGSTSFQEAPCERSQAQTAIQPLAEARKPGEGAPGPALQQPLKEAEAERLRTDATDVLRDRIEDLSRHRNSCDRQQREILSNRARAHHNLAGAVLEPSVATEAAAAATRCETRARELQAEVEEARRQCAARGCS